MIDLFYENKSILEHEHDEHHWNENSGVNPAQLQEELDKIEMCYQDAPVVVVKTKLITYILDHAQIEVNPNSLFADKINQAAYMRKRFERKIREVKTCQLSGLMEQYSDLQDTCTIDGNVDFGHTCPDWDYVLGNGFSGMLMNLKQQRDRNDLTKEQGLFYNCSIEIYEAAIRWIKRLANEAKRLHDESPYMPIVSDGLNGIAEHKPKTFYEALATIFIYYELQQNFDCSFVRSLGSLDTILEKFYEDDIREKRITEDDARIMLRHFMFKFRAKKITANMPFSLCGSNKDGSDRTNAMTYLILEEYIKLDIHDPKIHICMHDGIDDKIVDMVLKSIINGKNSFVFMNDKVVRSALRKIGIDEEDCFGYAVVGCYEPCAYRTEIACTTNGNINIPKAVELALTDGIDLMTGKRLVPACSKKFDDFSDFFHRVKEILFHLCSYCMDEINNLEKNYMLMNPTPVFSGAHEISVGIGRDIYAGSVKYNNSSINALGIATAVDSLIAIKHLVYVEKSMSLGALTEILKNNWDENEQLRLKCRTRYPKYGNNLDEPDEIMLDICRSLADYINGKPNGRGGVYRLGMFSIDTRFVFGKHTGASCDGRMAGETLSKNMSAVLGCDFRGVTSLINSVTKIDYERIPNGTVLDLTLHNSAVSGKEGFVALKGLLLTYLQRGGMAVHINVLNPDELRKAQEKPEDYKNLQVRLCGWNVYFVNLSRKEQDEFIYQLEVASDE